MFADELKRIRQEKKWTQKELAKKIHKSVSVISSWEGCSGHSPPECPWRLYYGQWRTGPSWPIRPWPCHPRRLWLSSIYSDDCAASQPLQWEYSG